MTFSALMPEQPEPSTPAAVPKPARKGRNRRRRRGQEELRQGTVCAYCGSQATGRSVDHVVPTSRGGGNSRSNLVRTCRRCDAFKGNRTPAEMVGILRRMLAVLEPFAETGTATANTP